MTPAPANTPPRRFSRPRPRLRKAAKWGGLILSILLIAAWVVSAWLDAAFVSRSDRIGGGLATGQVGFLFIDDESFFPDGYSKVAWSDRPRLEWWFWSYNGKGVTGVDVPLWALTLPTMAITVFAWRRDAAHRRAALLTLCSSCGYDRAGLPAGTVCPECGAAAPTAASATERTTRPTR